MNGGDVPSRGAPPPLSPCVRVCRLDDARRVCTGCWRTVGEIAAWWTMGDDEKRAVLAALPARRAARSAEPR